ncbi:MAG: HD-GYP domain-containing protein, partial [Candidatus Solibacter usitatus]|nr:HD-GYP domain-containing protein [Candidatus Solibacter usitatus]
MAVRGMSLPARFYIGIVIALGGSLLLLGLLTWELQNPARFLVFSVLAAAVSRWKVSLPAIKGTMSVNFLVILVSIVQMSLTETLLLGCGSIVVQYLWHAKERRQVLKVLFNLSSVMVAITLSYDLFHWGWLHAMGMEFPLKLALVACIYFVVNTGSVAVVIAFTEGKGLAKVWRDCYFWSFPYYILGAAVVGLFDLGNRVVGWQTSVLVLPVVYLIYRSYRLYLGRLETEKAQAEIQRLHAEEMSALHLRTIEALALAIAAKDSTTHDHLQRVQVYALEIGRELGLAEDELEALRAAALLHDIGKLAVPEHIISKPGKLTPEEFEKMKIHPLVGAEILDRVQFPYSVAPIVRSHHEKWNGAGYPHGLRGEQIPIGARILAAVDCLDALASDRQYRRALPLDEAMAWVAAESGKSFDPRVVGILHRRYRELDEIARETPVEDTRLSTNVRIHRGAAPAAGFEHSGPAALTQSERRPEFLASIAAARQEVQVLFEMAQDLGNSLELDDTLSVLGVRLKKIIPYEGMAVYMLSGD